MRHRIEIYEDMICDWRWRLRAPNGRIVADGSEGYSRRRDVLRAVKAMRRGMFFAGEPIEATR